jgi:adenylate cyclase
MTSGRDLAHRVHERFLARRASPRSNQKQITRALPGLKLGLLVGLLGLCLSVTPVGVHLEEEFGLSWLFKLRGARQAPSDVIVVAIDRESAETLSLPAEPNKWPRSTHATLTANLANAGASVVAYDLLFDKSREPEHDADLARAIAAAQNVVLVGYLKRKIIPGKAAVDELVAPIPPIADSAAAIAPFPLPKVPARVNGFWTFVDSGGEDSAVLPVVAFQLHALRVYDKLLEILKDVAPGHATLLPASAKEVITERKVEALALSLRSLFSGNSDIATDVSRRLQSSEFGTDEERLIRSLLRLYSGSEVQYLNFYGPPRSVTTIPYSRALSASRSDTNEFEGKAVFIGFAESLQPDQKDNYYTVFSQDSGLDLSGVEIAATAFANLLEDIPVRRLSEPAHLGVIFGFGLLIAIACHYFSIVVSAVVLLSLLVAYLAIAVDQFSVAGIWLPLIVPLFLQAPIAFAYASFRKYRHADRERQNIKQAFGYFLPTSVVDQFVEKTHPDSSANQLVFGTCLATDAARYTAVAESMDPIQLNALMNDYYREVFRPVQEFGGIVSDVEGDAVLAIWAASKPDVELKKRACEASLAIASAVDRFNQNSQRSPLCTRIGLDSGGMSLGSVGAGAHYEYRAVGDTVNSAHRIQGLNKRLQTCVLASEATLDGVDEFLTRRVGSFLLAGKTRPLTIFELQCRKADASCEQLWLCEAFADALESYRRRQWRIAQKAFLKILRLHPGDGPTQFYLKLIARYLAHSPALAWEEGLVRVNDK